MISFQRKAGTIQSSFNHIVTTQTDYMAIYISESAGKQQKSHHRKVMEKKNYKLCLLLQMFEVCFMEAETIAYFCGVPLF